MYTDLIKVRLSSIHFRLHPR